MEPEDLGRTRYRLQTVARACDLLKLFSDDCQELTLAQIAARAHLEKTIAFRLVHTLEQEGLLRRIDGRRYCSNVRILQGKRYRVGYAAQDAQSQFSQAVTGSLRWAATQHQVDLIVLDNRYSPKTALRNADRLIAEGVDSAIEFQTYERVAPAVSQRFQAAGIPLIAVDIPHPGATFFGIDNYRVGLAAGRALAKAAKEIWNGEVEELLLLELDIAGSLPHLRLSGAEKEIRRWLPADVRVLHLDTKGEFTPAFEAVRRRLQSLPKRRTLITGVNDSAVVGALRAFEAAGRSEYCLALGLGGLPESRNELRRRGTRMIGAIAFFPERYGERLMQLALSLMLGRSVPTTSFAEFQLITPQTVNHFYPNDAPENG